MDSFRQLFLGLGELCIMPTIISAITQYAPKTIKSTMMGLLYLSLAFSGYFASLIGKLTLQKGQFSSPIIYFTVYIKIFYLALIITAVLMIVSYLVKQANKNPLFLKKTIKLS